MISSRKNLKSLIPKLKTSFHFTRNLFTTGALAETSRKVELEICRFIPKEKDVIVVEFGMGHGNITRQILDVISPSSRLYSFEVNKDFCSHVKETIHDSRLTIINDGAENIKKYIDGSITSVISSIPFSFFSKKKAFKIIGDSHDLLEREHYFSQVLYSKYNFEKFNLVFEFCSLKRLSNFPPEFIYHCQKK